MSDVNTRALVLDALGVQFVAYTLNLQVGELEHHLNADDQPLTDDRESVLQQLATFVSALNFQQTGSEALWHLNLDVLATVQADLRETWPNAMRTALGGSTEVRTVRGQHRQSLVQMARDVYPLFLIPTSTSPIPDPFTPPLSRPLYQHPLRQQFEQAVLRESALKTLFPEKHESSGWVGYVTHSTGSAGTLQLAMLPELLLRSGWRMARLEHAAPTLDQFVAGVLRSVDAVRAAAAGRISQIPVRIGITGVIADSRALELPWGRLRPAGLQDAELMPKKLDRQLSTTTASGKNITISYGGDLVLEMDVPYRLRAEVWDPSETSFTEWPADLRDYELIQQRLETVQLALLLGVEAEPRPKVLQSWTAVFDPLGHGAMRSWRDVATMSSLVPCRLSTSQIRTWGTWIRLIDERRTSSIGVAIKRVLLAATERRDPSDALLDAVIAWENLVGADEGETTLRITTALAWLLASGPAQRDELEQKLRALYRLRSRIVHGNPNITPLEAAEKHQEALGVTLAALRALFKKRPDLLAETTSKARSRRLLLKT